MKNVINPRFGLIVGMIALAAASRFALLNVPNFSPVGAMALFGGAYFAKKYWAFIVPTLGLWMSNLVLNNTVYKAWFPEFSFGFDAWTFGSFAVMVAIGIVIFMKKVNTVNFLSANLLGTVAFFLVSNFGVWMGSKMYTHDMNGLLECYALGLPFIKNTLLSNLLFSGILFGAFELAQRRFPSLSLAK
jgi:hypothetical protein